MCKDKKDKLVPKGFGLHLEFRSLEAAPAPERERRRPPTPLPDTEPTCRPLRLDFLLSCCATGITGGPLIAQPLLRPLCSLYLWALPPIATRLRYPSGPRLFRAPSSLQINARRRAVGA